MGFSLITCTLKVSICDLMKKCVVIAMINKAIKLGILLQGQEFKTLEDGTDRLTQKVH